MQLCVMQADTRGKLKEHHYHILRCGRRLLTPFHLLFSEIRRAATGQHQLSNHKQNFRHDGRNFV